MSIPLTQDDLFQTISDLQSRVANLEQNKGFALVTQLPANPNSGDIVMLVDSTTAPTYRWAFEYNAQSASTFQWEFLGGTPAYAFSYTSSASFSFTTYGEATNNPAAITLPRAGEYLCAHGLSSSAAGTQGYTVQAISKNNVAPSAGTDPSELYIFNYMPAVNMVGHIDAELYTLAANDNLRLMQRCITGNATVYSRYLKIYPQRVS